MTFNKSKITVYPMKNTIACNMSQINNNETTNLTEELMITKSETGTEGRTYYGHPKFYEMLEEMKTIHSNKNHDYASQSEPLSNFMLSEKLGIPAWKGCMVRITDKVSRLWSFAKQDVLKVSDESIRDTLIDLANYALLCAILYEETIQKSSPTEDNLVWVNPKEIGAKHE